MNNDECNCDQSQALKAEIKQLREQNIELKKIEKLERWPIKFPVELRKMWSGSEVQDWLDSKMNDELL